MVLSLKSGLWSIPNTLSWRWNLLVLSQHLDISYNLIPTTRSKMSTRVNLAKSYEPFWLIAWVSSTNILWTSWVTFWIPRLKGYKLYLRTQVNVIECTYIEGLQTFATELAQKHGHTVWGMSYLDFCSHTFFYAIHWWSFASILFYCNVTQCYHLDRQGYLYTPIGLSQ